MVVTLLIFIIKIYDKYDHYSVVYTVSIFQPKHLFFFNILTHLKLQILPRKDRAIINDTKFNNTYIQIAHIPFIGAESETNKIFQII